jgi:hypothetical protein
LAKTTTKKRAGKAAKATARVTPAPKAPARKAAKTVARQKTTKPSPAAPKPASKKPAVQIAAQPQLRLAQQKTPATTPTVKAEAQPPKQAAPIAPLRADLPPTSGFTMLVDGHFKGQFATLKQAQAAAAELLGRFPMLRLEIYDAAKKVRVAV